MSPTEKYLFDKFAGSFDKVHGGFVEDAAQSLSGGIYDLYHSELVLNRTGGRNQTASKEQLTVQFHSRLKNLYKNNFNRAVPNVNELFQILRYAIRTNNAVGASSSNVSIVL